MATSNVDLYRRGQVPSIPGADAKYLKDELSKLEAQQAKNYDKFSLVEKDISGNAAAIELERQTRADETGSLAQQILTITATGARTSTFAQASAPASAVEGDIWVDTDDSNRMYRYSAGTGWVEVSDARITETQALITLEQTARQDADSAQATTISNVSAQATRQRITRGTAAPSAPQLGDLWIDTTNGNLYKYWNGSTWVASDDVRISQTASAVTAEQNARSTGDSANATRIDQVEANANSALGSLDGRVTTVTNAQASFQTSAASRLDTVEASSAKVRVFRQSTTPTANFIGDLWFNTLDSNKCKRWDGTTWVSIDNPKIDANVAAITSEQNARIGADSALSTRIDSVTSSVNLNSAAITSEQTTRAAADSAMSSRIDSVSSTVSGHTTSISTVTSSVNGLKGRYGVTIDNNGYVSGISLLSDASNGHPTSTFRIVADKFAIRAPGAGSDSIYWDGANLVVRGNILATSVQSGAVSTRAKMVNSILSCSIPASGSALGTATDDIVTITCSGGDLVGNLALALRAGCSNVNATTAWVQINPVLNGSQYAGQIIDLYLPMTRGYGGSRVAQTNVPLIFDAGAKTGVQTLSFTISVTFYDQNGSYATGSGSLTVQPAGYLQEMKA